MDSMERIVQVVSVIFQLAPGPSHVEDTLQDVKPQERQDQHALVRARTIKLQGQNTWQNLVCDEAAVNHGQDALARVIGCGADHSWAQDDMAASVPMDKTVADLERHRREAVDGFVRPLSVRSGQMRQHELVAAAAVHGQIQLGAGEVLCSTSPIGRVAPLLLYLQQMMLCKCILPNPPKVDSDRGHFPFEVLALGAPPNVHNAVEDNALELRGHDDLSEE